MIKEALRIESRSYICEQTTLALVFSRAFHLFYLCTKINFGKRYHCMTHQILHSYNWTVYKSKFKMTISYSSCLCHAELRELTKLTAISYQMQSSFSGLRKVNLPATLFIFFKWLISFLLVIGKIHYNGGIGW